MLACNPSGSTNQTSTTELQIQEDSSLVAAPPGTKTILDMAHIAPSSAEIGVFPFVNLPKGLIEMNKPLMGDYDVCFFPIAGVMTPVEGRLYKTYISAKRGQNFSQHYF